MDTLWDSSFFLVLLVVDRASLILTANNSTTVLLKTYGHYRILIGSQNHQHAAPMTESVKNHVLVRLKALKAQW